MAAVTQQQLEGAGFVITFGSGARFQCWLGPDNRAAAPPGNKITIVWDSTSGRYKIVSDIGFRTLITIAGTASVLNDLITAIPNAAVPLVTKNALKTDLLAAFMED